MTINHVFAGIAVADYDSALAWYKRFFGRSPDVIVTENEAMWQAAETGWIYVVGDANRAFDQPRQRRPRARPGRQ